MRSLIALDIHGGDGFVRALRRIWDDGDAVLPVDAKAPAGHLRSILDSMRPAAIEDAGGERVPLDNAVPVDDCDALVIATSGTTGRPKGVVHTHESMQAAARMTGEATATTNESRWVACLPLSHIGGFSVVTRALGCGAGIKVHDGFDASSVDSEGRIGATHVSLVPAVLERIDTSPWQLILLGGSSIPDDRPANSIATYGMTETFGGVVYDGRALPGVDIRIGDGSVIEVRSPTLLNGYRSADMAATGSALLPDGFFRSGDIGSLDPTSGALTVEGRVDDLIISGGVKVWPEPVERLIAAHPAVAECAVVGREDPEWGQVVVAVVVPTSGTAVPALAELRDLVKNNLPSACAPREILVRSQLPRTTSGKVRRNDAL